MAKRLVIPAGTGTGNAAAQPAPAAARFPQPQPQRSLCRLRRSVAAVRVSNDVPGAAAGLVWWLRSSAGSDVGTECVCSGFSGPRATEAAGVAQLGPSLHGRLPVPVPLLRCTSCPVPECRVSSVQQIPT